MSKFFSRRAETLAEAVMAVTVLGIGSGGVIIMLNGAIRANDVGQERIVALNLAQEAVAAVEILRDTNWLRFPGNREACWDTLDAATATECGTPSATVLENDGVYVPYRDLTDSSALMAWKFSGGVAPATPTATDQALYQYEIAGQPFWNSSLGVYPPSTLAGTPTPYSRALSITDKTALEMTVTATVTWESRNQPHSVNFSTKLYNHP